MNIIKTTGIGILLIMLCTMCSKFPEDPGMRPLSDSKFLSITAEVSETEFPLIIANNDDIELYGNVASCNLYQSGAPCITIFGIIKRQPNQFGSFRIEDGELLLESTTTDCKLWGEFNGIGSLDGDQFTINSDVAVTCGTGVFNSNGGKLNMMITGILPTQDHPVSSYELILKGELEN
jgi:hypothetical protein